MTEYQTDQYQPVQTGETYQRPHSIATKVTSTACAGLLAIVMACKKKDNPVGPSGGSNPTRTPTPVVLTYTPTPAATAAPTTNPDPTPDPSQIPTPVPTNTPG